MPLKKDKKNTENKKDEKLKTKRDSSKKISTKKITKKDNQEWTNIINSKNWKVFRKYKIEPKRLRFIYPKKNEECNNILIEGIKDGNPGSLRILPPLYIYEDDGKWTDEVLKIYNYEEW